MMMTTIGPGAELAAGALWLVGAREQPAPRRTAAEREEMILRYLSLVRYVVGRLGVMPSALLDHEDLTGYGMLGLIDAVDRFDPARGVKFETYAIPRIRGYIVDRLRELDPLSRSSRRRARAVEQTATLLEQEEGRPARPDEVAACLGLETDAVRQALNDARLTVLSLDSQTSGADDNSPASRLDLLVDEGSLTPLGAAENRDIAAALEALPAREREIIRLHYVEDLTMKQVSRLLGVSESRICQLHSRALDTLRAHLQGAAVTHAA